MGVKTKSNYSPSGRDLFQTPRYATELLIPFIPKYAYIWECAAGNGAIVNVLTENGFLVAGSDMRPSKDYFVIDFLSNTGLETYRGFSTQHIIITNPPFSRKKQFYERCLEINAPFALLVPADYSGWMIDAVRNKGCTKIVPTRRIDYITPSGKDAIGGHTADFHSLWLTRGFIFQDVTEIFVDLSLEDKKRIY